MKAKNQRYYDAHDGKVDLALVNTKGEVVFQRPVRTPEQALEQFKFAVEAWFACMDPITRGHAVNYAISRENLVEYKPTCEPK